MRTHAPSSLPARILTRRAIAPIALSCTLVATTLTAVVAWGGPADAAPAAGSYEIGNTPIQLNQPTDPGIGALTPTADAAENGMFGPQIDWPLVPLHAGLTRDGQLVTFGTPTGGSVQDGLNFDQWNPALGSGANAHVTVDTMDHYDSFCAGLVMLPDGRMLMASGDSYRTTMIYDPTTHTQTMGATLNYYRWYTTAIRLTDDRILLIGGANPGDITRNGTPDQPSGIAITPEIGSGTGAWTPLTGATSEALFGSAEGKWWYPRTFISPNGGLDGISGKLIWHMTTTGDGSIAQTGTLPFNPMTSGSQVMYEPGKVLIAGGGSAGPADAVMGNADAAIIDFNGATPKVTSIAPMSVPRTWLNLTVLPTGEVLANGGTKFGTAAGDANSDKQAEIWNPTTGAWRTAATAQRTRTYHSTALVLPSGAVFTGGGGAAEYTGSGGAYGPENNLNAELYYPAYLFTKNANGTSSWASRPTITSIAGDATWGGTLSLTTGDNRGIASASLINVASVTHSQNVDQRRIPLNITQQGGTVKATLPGSNNTMPPGDYELTLVDNKGVASPAQIISIRNGAAGLVTIASSAGDSSAAPAGSTNGNGDPGSSGAGTTAGTGNGKETGTGTTTITLKKNSTVGFAALGKAGTRVWHSGTKLALRGAGMTASTAVKKASSWIVRTGLGSKKGYSFESVDKPGYYLVAPSDGTGTVTLAKKSTSKSFAARATFSVVEGVTGHDASLRLTAKPGYYLRNDGTRLVTSTLGTSGARKTATTFAIKKGLAKR